MSGGGKVRVMVRVGACGTRLGDEVQEPLEGASDTREVFTGHPHM